MTTSVHTDAARRHDFVFLFDVVDGNPNGDPDAGNMPRVDPETLQGIVTDVAIKRRLRDWVHAFKGSEERYKIYMLGGPEALNSKHQRAYTATNLKSLGPKQPRADIEQARQWMCDNFYDVRTFGAAMSTGVNAGQVRGPLQLTFARSVDPVSTLDLTITRVVVTRQEDADVVVEESGRVTGKQTELGRKQIIPYGLYRAYGFYNPHFAASTGFDDADLALFWQALTRAWDLDRSAARGMMACRGLYIFSHSSPLGDAPAHQLLERVRITRRDAAAPARVFADYSVKVSKEPLPSGVTLTTLDC